MRERLPRLHHHQIPSPLRNQPSPLGTTLPPSNNAIRSDLLDQRGIRAARLEEQIAIALAGERGRDPGVSVVEIPHRDAHTALRVGARADRRLVVCLLLRLLGGGRRQVRATHVELGDGDVDAQAREGGHVGLLRGLGRGLADDEVRLETDAVDFDLLGLEAFDEVLGRGGFVAGVFWEFCVSMRKGKKRESVSRKEKGVSSVSSVNVPML